MWSRICALAASSLLAACGATVQTVCPPLKSYDQPFLSRLADELERAPGESAMVRAVLDYRELRDMIRACKGT
jgi:hypothetical protein